MRAVPRRTVPRLARRRTGVQPAHGTYAQTRQGSNVYGNWGSSSVQRGDSWAQTAHRENYRTGQTTAGFAPAAGAQPCRAPVPAAADHRAHRQRRHLRGSRRERLPQDRSVDGSRTAAQGGTASIADKLAHRPATVDVAGRRDHTRPLGDGGLVTSQPTQSRQRSQGPGEPAHGQPQQLAVERRDARRCRQLRRCARGRRTDAWRRRTSALVRGRRGVPRGGTIIHSGQGKGATTS